MWLHYEPGLRQKLFERLVFLLYFLKLLVIPEFSQSCQEGDHSFLKYNDPVLDSCPFHASYSSRSNLAIGDSWNAQDFAQYGYYATNSICTNFLTLVVANYFIGMDIKPLARPLRARK